MQKGTGRKFMNREEGKERYEECKKEQAKLANRKQGKGRYEYKKEQTES